MRGGTDEELQSDSVRQREGHSPLLLSAEDNNGSH